MRVITLLVLALAVAINSSVAHAEDGLSLCLSQETVASHLKTVGTHQFSAVHQSNRFECVSYTFGSQSIRYYFVFKNDQLISLLNMRPFFADAFETKPNPNPKYAGTKISVRKPWRAEDFMQRILAAKTMTPGRTEISSEHSTR